MTLLKAVLLWIGKSRLSVACLAVFILNSSFFASAPGNTKTFSASAAVITEFLSLTNPFFDAPEETPSFFLSKMDVYDSLRLDIAGLNREAFEYGLRGMEKLIEEGRANNQHTLSIVDFSQPSDRKRLYVIDLDTYSLVFNTWVAHGRNSGREMAASFSNLKSSNKSSLGFYLTGNTYNGKHGYSLKLTGLEKGINDNALNRAIVIHGASYVSELMASRCGYIGRSQGCPALSRELFRPIIDEIKDGACLFIYYPSDKYLQHSALLN